MSEQENFPPPVTAERVTAVMLTGVSSERERYARGALRCFLEQSYLDRELVIVNQGDYCVLNDDIPGVKEIKVSDDLNYGQMWNIGLDHASGDWVMSWDDDDWSHPHRMAFQMASRRPGHAVTLRKFVFVDLLQDNVTVTSDTLGHAGTIMFPRPRNGERFKPEMLNVDADFYLKHFVRSGKYVVLENDPEDWPGSALYVRFWHGGNISGPENFQKLLNRSDASAVTEEHTQLLQEILPEYYGVDVTVSRSEE